MYYVRDNLSKNAIVILRISIESIMFLSKCLNSVEQNY